MSVQIINKVEDYYKNHRFIAIPVCGYEDNDGNYVYDLEAIEEEINKSFMSLGVDVYCTLAEYEV